ncbi:MAG TPA: MFS transporter [Mycobacteriales bacterium]|nr:MFS transporter [Mycobacteriales bacterium]
MDAQTIHRRRWGILAVLVLALLVVILDNTILNVALKTIQQDLGASQSQLEWAINAFTLVFAGLMFTFGVLGDRLGRRRLLVIGLLLFGASSALSAWSSSPGMLIATRALMGVGAAMVQPQTLSLLTNVFTGSERPKALGIWAGFAGLAVAIGPVTGGLLLEHFWWGSIFLINVPIVIIGVTLVMLVVPESSDPDPKPLDPIGVVLSIAGVTALVYGIISGGNSTEWGSLKVAGPIAAGVLLLAAFVLVERRISHPALDVSLFKKPAFAAASAAITLTFFALSGSIFYTTFYLQAVRGYEPLAAGALVSPVALGLLVAGTTSARNARRFGTKVVVTTGMVVAALAMGAYHLVGRDTPIALVELLGLALGLGMGSIMAPATESVMSTIPRAKAGAGSAVNNTVRMLGGAFGVAIIGSILSASYRAALGDKVNALPAGSRHEAGESIGGTLNAVANATQSVKDGRLSPTFLRQVPELVDSAKNSFMTAMHTASLWSMGVLLVASVVVGIYLPNKRAAAGKHEASSQVDRFAAAASGEPPREPEIVGVGR